ncbi:hypothetical protein GBA52_008028 [Prunus armeniaca]|nr:hypothetical protein GBA52_008028 [Prunus armeniaca]
MTVLNPKVYGLLTSLAVLGFEGTFLLDLENVLTAAFLLRWGLAADNCNANTNADKSDDKVAQPQFPFALSAAVGESVDCHPVPKSRSDGFKASSNVFSLPLLSFGETFEDAYQVILILDDREQFATQGTTSIKSICQTHSVMIDRTINKAPRTKIYRASITVVLQ